MNGLDVKLLEELKKNARLSNVELAKKIRVSEGSIRNHLASLSRNRIIRKFTVEVNLPTDFRAVTLINTASGIASKKVIQKLSNIKGIDRMFEVSGEFDLVVETRTSSPSEYNSLIEKIRAIKGIETTETLVVLDAH